MRQAVQPTGNERFFGEDQLIVSKTDTRGRITYANDVFLHIASYTEAEVLGQPHSLIRHPDMPRAVFKLLWETLESGNELFAYVKNMAKNGDHYWVFAHVTPTFDRSGRIIGYHSNRRTPDRGGVQQIAEVYALLRKTEQSHSDARAGLQAGYAQLMHLLKERNLTYEQFAFSLAA